MKQHKDPKIELIQQLLESRALKIEDLDNGIRVYLNFNDYNNCSVDIYVLRNNPRFVRAKFCSPKLSTDKGQRYLDRIHATLQKAIAGAANLEKFHLLGNRGDIQVYYAPLSLTEEAGQNISSSELRLTPTRTQDQDSQFDDFVDIDTKLLRKTLDRIKLPRSSIVRLAITRIFRESVDSSEIKQLVAREAQRITKPSEKKQLKLLQEQKLPPSISAIIHLLSENLPP